MYKTAEGSTYLKENNNMDEKITNNAFLENLFDKMVSLYRLDQVKPVEIVENTTESSAESVTAGNN